VAVVESIEEVGTKKHDVEGKTGPSTMVGSELWGGTGNVEVVPSVRRYAGVCSGQNGSQWPP